MLILVGRALQFALTLLALRVMTTLLAPAEVGRLSLVTTGAALFALVLISPVGMFINRRLYDWVQRGLLLPYLRVFLVYLVMVGALSGAVAWTLSIAGLLPTADWAASFAALVAGFLLVTTPNQTFIPALNMLGHLRPFVVLTIGALLVSNGLAIAAVIAWAPTMEVWLAGLLLGQLLFGFVAYASLRGVVGEAEQRATINRAKAESLGRFALPLSLSVAFGWLHMQGYRFGLAEGVGLHEFGLFAAGYGAAASLIGALEVVLSTYFQPAFYRACNSDDAAARARAWPAFFDAMIPLAMLGSACAMILAPQLAALMLGPDFQSAAPYIGLGALAEWARVVFGTAALKLHAKMQTARLIVPSLVGACLAQAGIFFALERFGLVSIPIVVAAAAVVATAILFAGPAYRDDLAAINWRLLGRALLYSLVLAVAAFTLGRAGSAAGMLASLSVMAVVGVAAVGAAWLLVTRDSDLLVALKARRAGAGGSGEGGG